MGNSDKDFQNFYNNTGGAAAIDYLGNEIYENKLSLYNDGYAKLMYGMDEDGNAKVPQAIKDKLRLEANSEAFEAFKSIYAMERSGEDPTSLNYFFNPLARASYARARALAVTSKEDAIGVLTKVSIDIALQYVGRSFVLRNSYREFQNVYTIIRNPKKLEGLTLEQGQKLIGDPSGWKVGTMQRSSRASGWTIRQMNDKGTDPTDLYIQYHPGTPRHFGGKPYWKVSSGSGGTERFLAK